MPLTHFPYGVASFNFPLIGSGPWNSIEAIKQTPAQVFFVSVTGDDGMEGTSPSTAFRNIQTAVNKCTTSVGAFVFLGEGRWQEQVIITQRGLHLIGMGAYRTQIQAPSGGAAVMTAFDGFKPIIAATPLSGNGYAFEIANMRVGGNGGYPGIYLGDGAVSGNASSSTIHDCLIDGSNYEGTYGIILYGGSFMDICNNLIVSQLTGGILMSSGATRTLYGNVVRYNNIVNCKGNGITLTGVCNSNLIRENVFLDSSAAALTNGILGTGSTGTKNGAVGNYFCTAGTKINMVAGDYASGNYAAQAGNAAQFVTTA
jgi:hypothetical protein